MRPRCLVFFAAALAAVGCGGDGAGTPEPLPVFQEFVQAAREGDAERLYELLTPDAQRRYGRGIASELGEGLGSFPEDSEVVLSTPVPPRWAVVAIARRRVVEGMNELGVYAVALRRVEKEWRVALGEGPEIRPAPGDDLRALVSGTPDEVRVWIDGETVEPAVRGGTVAAQPPPDLDPGTHTLVVFARKGDRAGARGWPFESG